MRYAGYESDYTAALDAFTVKQYEDAGNVRYLRADADTGSNYVVYAARDPRPLDNPTWVVTVMYPWTNAQDGMTEGWEWDPEYVRSHLGNPGRDQHHAGDLAAITMCVNMILGKTQAEADAWTRYFV